MSPEIQAACERWVAAQIAYLQRPGPHSWREVEEMRENMEVWQAQTDANRAAYLVVEAAFADLMIAVIHEADRRTAVGV